MVSNYLLGIVREGQFKWLIGHVRELHGVVKKEKKGPFSSHESDSRCAPRSGGIHAEKAASCSQRWIHSPIINDSERDARWVVRICPAIKTYITLFEFSVPFIAVDDSGKEKKAFCTW